MITGICYVLGFILYLTIGYGIELEYVKRTKSNPQESSHIMFLWLFLLIAWVVQYSIEKLLNRKK